MVNIFNQQPNNYPEEIDENLSVENAYEEQPEEGQLSVDVFQTQDKLIVKSTIAGVKPEDINISVENDVLTIRGSRKYDEQVSAEDYYYQECYWGNFSRSIVLPVPVDTEKIEATLKNGVLTINMPKLQKANNVSVKVKGE